MNLQELDDLIRAIPSDEPEMLRFYQNMRVDLVAEITAEISKILSQKG